MQVRTLYLHWVDMLGCNHLVGEIRELLKPNEFIYEIEYYEDCVKLLSSKFDYFDRVSGCPFEKRLLFRYTNKIPWFILERTPSEKRPDLNKVLSEAGLKYYDRWAYITWSHGVSNIDRYFVSEKEHDVDYKHPWLHDLSIRMYNKSSTDSLKPMNVFLDRN